jgi:hypothetical protein
VVGLSTGKFLALVKKEQTPLAISLCHRGVVADVAVLSSRQAATGPSGLPPAGRAFSLLAGDWLIKPDRNQIELTTR